MGGPVGAAAAPAGGEIRRLRERQSRQRVDRNAAKGLAVLPCMPRAGVRPTRRSRPRARHKRARAARSRRFPHRPGIIRDPPGADGLQPAAPMAVIRESQIEQSIRTICRRPIRCAGRGPRPAAPIPARSNPLPAKSRNRLLNPRMDVRCSVETCGCCVQLPIYASPHKFRPFLCGKTPWQTS